MEEIRMPFDVKPEDALLENIHPFIIQKPTEDELKKAAEQSAMVSEHVNSLLRSKPEWVELEMARRAEFIYRNDMIFCINETDRIGEEEATKRIKAACVNLANALIRQGKFEEAKLVAWEGIRIGANTITFFQKAATYEMAINRADDNICNCPDIVIDDLKEPGEAQSKIFGGTQEKEVAIISSLQVVDSVPSYKHDGETVDILRCSHCGMHNAMKRSDIPSFALNANTINPEEKLPTMRLGNGDTIQRTVYGFKRLSPTDTK